MDNNKNKQNKRSRKGEIIRLIIAIILTAVITYFVTLILTIRSYLSGSGIQYFSTKLNLIKQKLDTTYIRDYDEDKMLEEALKGYVKGVNDKYTQYLNKEEMTSLMEDTTGSFVGIGVYMADNTADNTVLIIGVIEDSVAEKAGIKAGDRIINVDGIEYKGEQLDSVVKAIKGEEGTTVNIIIQRGEEELSLNLIRSSVKIKTVSSELIKDIGYIQISSFNEGTSNEFEEAYKKLKEHNPKGLIIDLRNNGGGLVNESIDIAETMVEKNKILLITEDKNKKEDKTISRKNPIVDIPVVLLINKNTASASEILAGCLKDNNNTKIIGTTSYGKGVIQTIFSFIDGSGLKVTTEEYFTPKHNAINSVGINPDIEVNLDPEWENISNIPHENDLQLQKAVEELSK